MLRILITIGVIVASLIKQRPFILNVWLVTIATIIWHFLLIILSHKLPRYFCNLHAPLLVVSFYFNTAMMVLSALSYVVIIQNVIGFAFFLICGLALSASWILTSIAILINLIGALLIIVLHYNINDVGTVAQYIVISALVIYVLYFKELVMKNEFLRY